jgi:hypothetical protein
LGCTRGWQEPEYNDPVLICIFLVVTSYKFLMDPSIILIWNVHGLNSTTRQDAVRSLVVSTKADIVCIQETKMENISRRVVFSALGSNLNQYVFVPSVGASGGILVVWKHNRCHMEPIRGCPFRCRMEICICPFCWDLLSGLELMCIVVRFNFSQPAQNLGGLHVFMGHQGVTRARTMRDSCSLHWPLGYSRRFQSYSQRGQE